MGTRLYVGNLPFTADETQIRDLFAQSGRTVSEVKLVTDRDTGRPRGFGFVEMGSRAVRRRRWPAHGPGRSRRS
jgi:RNA recognition motif-containing protein